jgi:hypothetical protein
MPPPDFARRLKNGVPSDFWDFWCYGNVKPPNAGVFKINLRDGLHFWELAWRVTSAL